MFHNITLQTGNGECGVLGVSVVLNVVEELRKGPGGVINQPQIMEELPALGQTLINNVAERNHAQLVKQIFSTH